jgi:hypothetical protein
VLSGDERSQPGKVGGKKGAANCTLAEGAKRPDTTPPALYIVPDDGAWHRGPAPVQLLAQDDYTGVQSVRYALDGGPVTEIRNGTTFTIPNEGVHTVQMSATDVAGNTASTSASVKVDSAPPTKPALLRPYGATSSTTPVFRWSPSTDSGSQLKGYYLAIRRGDGSVVAAKAFDASTTTAPSPAALNEGETYTATVTAVDNTSNAWTTDSDPVTFRVDSTPKVTATDPADGAVLAFGRESGNLTISLDRPADPATVSATTVALVRNSNGGPSIPVNAPSCASPCATITIHPTSALPEGRYNLTVAGVKSEEGPPFAAKTVKFAVPDPNNEFQNVTTTNATCTHLLADHKNTPVTTNGANETVLASFSYSMTGGTGTVTFVDGTTVLGSSPLPAGSGSRTLSTSFAAGSHPSLAVDYCVTGGTLSLSNLYVSRAP